MIEARFDRDILLAPAQQIFVGQETDNEAEAIHFVGLPVYDDNQTVTLFLTLKGRFADANIA